VSRRLVISPGAEGDISAAFAWYERQKAGLGDQFLDEVEQALVRVADGPLLYQRLRNNIRRAAVRRFPYSVYFLVDDVRISVLAVLHHRRRPGTWRRRGD
jgi:plasmid stabilization system protein ParE